MTEKKYAIVRVDGKCPDEFEKINLDYVCRNISCYQGKECSKNFYGDTKEQVIKKVAQVLFEAKLEIYKNVYGIIPNDKFMKDIYAKQLKVAKKIVEFLGVK